MKKANFNAEFKSVEEVAKKFTKKIFNNKKSQYYCSSEFLSYDFFGVHFLNFSINCIRHSIQHFLYLN
jgi:hypothetical protein